MQPPELRIIDANLNRAREALRVIEDYARFALDDAALAGVAKRIRHDLQAVAAAFDPAALLAARDIAGDVGRALKTPAELHRAVPLDIVWAAFGRLSESLRSISEYAKLPQAAQAAEIPSARARVPIQVEQLRYAAYEIEQALLLRGDIRRRFRNLRLYVILTASLCRDDWLATAEAALRGGAGCLQLREEELADAELLRRARALRDLTNAHRALLIINDRPDIAQLCRADGVHVGQNDLPVADVRRIAGPDRLVGVSTHTTAEFDATVAQMPDYVAVGKMFPSRTKPEPDVAGLAYLEECRPRTDLPLVAIGGIDAANAATVRRHGADCICVCAAVISSDHPESAARALTSTLVGT